MSAPRHHGWVAILVPVLVGFGLLGSGLLLLPDRREVAQASKRGHPAPDPAVAAAGSPPPQGIAAVPATPPVTQPTLAAAILNADAATLAALTARLIDEGAAVSTAQVAQDLVAKRRPVVALAYLAARPDGYAASTWRLRIDLLRATGHVDQAAALVANAARARGTVPAGDLVAAAYAIDRSDLIVVAAANGTVPPPDAALALDLARRADQARRDDQIAALDRVTRADWRAADPWLALRIASRTKDTAAALRAVNRLPPAQRDAAREKILTRAGDRNALRAMLLARATAPGAREQTVAEQLLAAGFRGDAMAVLRRAAIDAAPSATTAQRLLYLMGPRPTPDDLAWLKQRTMRGGLRSQLDWLALYGERDRPEGALAFLGAHPLASRTDVMLMRLSLARAAGDGGAARTLLAGLMDGRPLDHDQVVKLSAAAPARIDPAQAASITRLRVASGAAASRDRLDLAWSAWNAGDAPTAAGWLRDHLAAEPDDLPALRLMADVQAKIGGDRASRPWLERALAQTPPDSRARAELLDRLGRRTEAVALVETLRADAPQDRTLAALHARLLIAQGQPGRARMVLAR